MRPSRTSWCSSNEKGKARRRACHAQAKSTGGGGRRGMKCRDYGVYCARTMRASYRDYQKGWRVEDDGGDRDCVLVVRAYGIRGKNGDFVPGNQRRAGRCTSQPMQPARYTNKQSSLCTWARLSPQTETLALKNPASSEGLGVLPVVQDGDLLSPGCSLTVEGALAES